jgi:hypothetical protein
VFAVDIAFNVATSIPAPTSSRKEHAICVVAKILRRRFVPGVIRTPPTAGFMAFDRSKEGSRGTYASSTAATMASPAPSQSTLPSTLASSARTEKRAA